MALAGTAMPLFGIDFYAAESLLLGSLMFGTMQMLMRYEGHDITIKRLRRQQVTGALLMVAAGLLALLHKMGLYHIGSGEWKLCMSIAAVFEIYTAFRIPNALRAAGEDA